jgi:hypothetical protein
MVGYFLSFRLKFELFYIWTQTTPTSTCDVLAGHLDLQIQCLKYYGTFATWWVDYGHIIDLFSGLLLPPLALTVTLGLASWPSGRFAPAAD